MNDNFDRTTHNSSLTSMLSISLWNSSAVCPWILTNPKLLTLEKLTDCHVVFIISSVPQNRLHLSFVDSWLRIWNCRVVHLFVSIFTFSVKIVTIQTLDFTMFPHINNSWDSPRLFNRINDDGMIKIVI